MDHHVMPIAKAIERGLVNPMVKEIKPKITLSALLASVPSLDQVDSETLALELHRRLCSDDCLASLSIGVLWGLWIRSDEEIQRRAQPLFEPFPTLEIDNVGVSALEREALSHITETLHTQVDLDDLREMGMV